MDLQLGDQAKTGKISLNYLDESSASQFQIGQEAEPFTAFSYMQSITPHLMMGGRGKYVFGKGAFNVGLGGIYDKDENQIVARWSNTVTRYFFLSPCLFHNWALCRSMLCTCGE
jgi:hypothetical protein